MRPTSTISNHKKKPATNCAWQLSSAKNGASSAETPFLNLGNDDIDNPVLHDNHLFDGMAVGVDLDLR